MNTSENIQLQNDRVMLRPLEETDEKELINFVQNEPEIWTYSLKQLKNKDDLNGYISAAIKGRIAGTVCAFVVYDLLKKSYAGCTRFYNIDPFHKTIMLGYTWYGKDFQGTGLNMNVKYLMLGYAFDTLGYERVEFRADVSNERSIAAMKSIGCTVEGVLRQNFTIADKRRDSIVLSILKEEWQGTLKEKLFNRI